MTQKYLPLKDTSLLSGLNALNDLEGNELNAFEGSYLIDECLVN